MRGISRPLLSLLPDDGNTPADAGNLPPWDVKVAKFRKHPRRCGESASKASAAAFVGETPPQMRGIFDPQRQGSALDRNTPADAGNLTAVTRSTRKAWKHPRRCGESRRQCHRIVHGQKHPRRCGESAQDMGFFDMPEETLPQMRGILPHDVRRTGNRRNTPADAGNLVGGLLSGLIA